MKRILACTCLAIGLLVPRELPAGPPDVASIAADAKWVLHVDADTARKSLLLQGIWKKMAERGNRRQKVRAIGKAIGLASFDDLHGVTVYGSRFRVGSGVVLLHAELDRQTLIAHLREKPEHRTLEYDGQTLHQWVEKKGREGEHEVTAGFPGSDLVVAGRHPHEVQHAIDVIESKADSLATRDEAPLTEGLPESPEIPEGTVLVFRAVGLNAAEINLKSPVTRHTESFSLLVGEHEGEAFAWSKLKTTSPETAVKVRDLVEGFRAMLQLRPESGEAVRAVVDGLDVSADEGTVTAEWRAPAEQVGEALRELASESHKSK